MGPTFYPQKQGMCSRHTDYTKIPNLRFWSLQSAMKTADIVLCLLLLKCVCHEITSLIYRIHWVANVLIECLGKQCGSPVATLFYGDPR